MEYMIGGYAAFFIVILGYLWSLQRRETVVEREADLFEDETEAQ